MALSRQQQLKLVLTPVVGVAAVALLAWVLAPVFAADPSIAQGIQYGVASALAVVVVALVPTLLRRSDQLMGVLIALFWGFGVRIAGIVFVLAISRHTSCDPRAMLLSAVAVIALSALVDAVCFMQQSSMESAARIGEGKLAVGEVAGKEKAVA